MFQSFVGPNESTLTNKLAGQYNSYRQMGQSIQEKTKQNLGKT